MRGCPEFFRPGKVEKAGNNYDEICAELMLIICVCGSNILKLWIN
jgi:hypothetical protein